MAAAQNRYYERNRDKRLEQMREYARNRNTELRAQAECNPVTAQELRAMMAEKYSKWVANKTRRQIDGWLANPAYTATFKEFVRSCVEPMKDRVSRKFLNGLETLADAGRIVESECVTPIVDESSGEYTECEYYAYT